MLENLNREVKNIEGRTAAGLLKAAIFIQGESQDMVPQDKGVLINSAFSDVDPLEIVARVGYTAKYGPYVHEMPESFNYTKPGSGPKFLEKPLIGNAKNVLKIIRDEAEIK